MKIRFKKTHPDAKCPQYAHGTDAGADLVAVAVMEEGAKILSYDIGLAVEIPQGFVGKIYPRSSISKYDLALCNHTGIIDSGFLGTLKLKFRLTESDRFATIYKVGDKVGQLIVEPVIKLEFEEVRELPNTHRGSGGFGSSGN